MRPDKLAGCGVVITRPPAQAENLASRIKTAGGNPILFPLLEITALDDYTAFDAQASALDACDWAFFISTNAVEHGMQRLRVLHPQPFPGHLRWAAIGPATAAALQSSGVDRVLIPKQRYDSESLLACPELQDMQGQRCLVFRGVGGRELLAEKLRERGAVVDFAECYRRINPNPDLSPLTRLWQNGQLHAMVITSSEALRNLLNMARQADDADWLKQTPLFVSHPRIAEHAAQHGWQPITAAQPGDDAMLAALEQKWNP